MNGKEFDPASVAEDDFAFGDGAFSVGIVSAFAVNIGLETGQNRDGIGFVEDRHVVHRFECGDYFSAVILMNHGPQGTFDGAHAGVAVEADDQDVAESLRVTEASDMAHVEQVEASVGPGDPLALRSPGFSETQQIGKFANFR